MKASDFARSVQQRFNAAPSGDHLAERTARSSPGARPPEGLSLRASTASLPPRAQSRPLAPSTAGLTVATLLPERSQAPEVVPQRLQADLQKATDQVGWLASLHKDVEDQTARVLSRLNLAEKELADRQGTAGLHPQSEIQPAEPAAAGSTPAGLRQIRDQVNLLSWRHGALKERQQQVTRMLQEARNTLAQVQRAAASVTPQHVPARPLATATPRAASPVTPLPVSPDATPSSTPFATPRTTPTVSPFATPGASPHDSPAASRPASPQHRAPSAGSAAPAMASQPPRVARLEQQVRELEQAAQQLQGQLDRLDGRALPTATGLAQATSQFKAAEAGVSEAILNKDAGAQARFDLESAKAYALKTALQQREAADERSQELLTALLGSVERDLAAARQRLAAAGGPVGDAPDASPRSPAVPPSPVARPMDDAELLKAAMPQGSAALARLAARAARASPRSLKDRLRATFQGRPKPMEGPRQDAFIKLVQADVMAVARHGERPVSAAIDLIRTAVTEGTLGAALPPNERGEWLAALNVVQVDQAHLG